jgi:nucleoside-diphosphate kinase
MTIERTFTMIKPDGIRRGLMGQILSRFERCGLTVIDIKMESVSRELAEKHYGEHRGKYFYELLLTQLLSGPVLIMALEGAHAVEVVRKLVGNTEPRVAQPGTIRGDFCHMGYGRSSEKSGAIYNLVHASDSLESAKKELELWFGPSASFNVYERSDALFF